MLRSNLVLSGTLALALFSCSSDDGPDNSGGSGGARAGSGGSGGTSGGSGGTSGGSGGASGGAAGSSAGGAAGSAMGGSGGTAGDMGDAGGDMGGAGGMGEVDAGMGGMGGSMGGAGGAMGGAGGAMGGAGGAMGGAGGGSAMMSFFVTSATSATGNLGGLEMADAKCAELATAVGVTGKKWRAYLSADMGPGGQPVNARDRIGPGPWHNSQGMVVAMTNEELHARKGDAAVFLDEKGARINGQWQGSPSPNQHDILTGTNPDGTVAAGKTCSNWTSASGQSRVGHSDGLGPNMTTTNGRDSWNSAHDGSGGCGNTQPGGGAGRYYCFVDSRP